MGCYIGHWQGTVLLPLLQLCHGERGPEGISSVVLSKESGDVTVCVAGTYTLVEAPCPAPAPV